MLKKGYAISKKEKEKTFKNSIYLERKKRL
jgi:hypothetical protein